MQQRIDHSAREEELRKLLHERIDRVDAARLEDLSRIVLECEAKELREKLDEAFEKDRAEQRVTDEKVRSAVALHRVRRPYGK